MSIVPNAPAASSRTAAEPRGHPAGRDEAGPLPDAWPEGFVATSSDRLAALALLSLRGITPLSLLVLAAAEGTARATVAALLRGVAGSDRDRAHLRTVDPTAVERAVANAGARTILWGDREYPPALADLADPPLGLFVRGRELDASRPCVAMVGARNCTPYGGEVAANLGTGLARAGVAVVSGAARGIDAAAHRGALDAGGPTIAVLGSGIDVAYPHANRKLIERIADDGTVLSEYPPGTPPDPFRFPARNRIVAGLSRAVIVVEGAPGSGSMITVEHATDCGRDVWAVPGPVTAPLSAVPNELIRGGAPLIRSVADALDELGLPGGVSVVAEALPPGPRGVLAALGGVGEEPGALAARTGLPQGEVLTALLELEMRGLVRRVGGRFERTLRAGP